MRFSLSKINQLLKTNLTLEAATTAFNKLGFEVEDTYQLSSVVAKTLVVGKIVEIKKHPNANRLNICQVKINKTEVQQIICGASNVALNANVIVALPGTKLPEITIAKSEIRGIESLGMLCSLSELGISKKFLSDEQLKGIFIFECADNFLGSSAPTYLGLDEQFIELAILNDRSDMHSLFNVALELGAYLKKPVHKFAFNHRVKNNFKNNTKVTIKAQNYDAYSNVLINNYQVAKSPWWLVKYLMGINIKPVNLLKDLANYVNNLTSNPIDILDADKIKDFNFEIINDPKNYKGDFEYQLSNQSFSNKVVLKNQQAILSIGASIHNLAMTVSENTTSLLVSSSSYSNLIARKYIKEFNNLNPNLIQHAKGSNPFSITESLTLFVNLLNEIVSDINVSEIKTFDTCKYNSAVFQLSIEKLNSYLGYQQDWSEAIAHLTRLGFKIEKAKNVLTIKVPSYRKDIEIDVNLIAEFIRTLDYDKIKILPPIGAEENTYPDARFQWENQLNNILSAHNLFNTKTYSLVNQDHYQDFDIFSYPKPIKIQDPLSSSHQVMRLSLINSLLSALEYNANNYKKDVNLFEIGNVYYGDHQYARHLALVINGNFVDSSLFKDKSLNNDFYVVKGLINSLIGSVGIKEIAYQPLVDHPHFHPGTSAKIMINNQVIGCIGKPHPQFYNKFSPIVVTLDLGLLFAAKKTIYIENISKLANVERDLSFIVADDLLADQLINIIKKTPTVNFADVVIFDLYVDADLKVHNQKVLSIKYWVKQLEKTLNKKDLESIMNKIITHVSANLDIKIRT